MPWMGMYNASFYFWENGMACTNIPPPPPRTHTHFSSKIFWYSRRSENLSLKWCSLERPKNVCIYKTNVRVCKMCVRVCVCVCVCVCVLVFSREISAPDFDHPHPLPPPPPNSFAPFLKLTNMPTYFVHAQLNGSETAVFWKEWYHGVYYIPTFKVTQKW